ncbi:MAG: MFS transporter [Syntrophales bacterium]|mgnify:FL=1|jgi:MFS family permease|nr:MFS transporter [Syntrophales bacterium]MDD4338930.1 MFS transporter [Syntrophales bacterium]HPB69526.1 MFS transporter [Syntrophales bacterium]HQN25189.1 MFS transporter [Syntrophales bacterium]HQP27639.1 MFS transporter [Syntrophales bacterium]
MEASEHPHGAQDFKVSRGYAYYVFLLLFLLYLFNYVDRMVVAAIFPYLKADWGLTDTQCGWFASIVTLMMTVFVFPVSLLVDRWSRKKAIGIMAVLWSFGAAACAFTRNFTQLFTMRSLVGVGEAAYTSGGHAMIAAYFPEEKRATMNGLFTAAIPMGTAIGVILGGVIAETLGWRYAFGILAVPGLIVAILFFWVKDYKTVQIVRTTGDGAQAVRVKMKFADIVREFLHTPSVLFTYLGYVGNTFVTTGLMNWLPSYYHRVDGLPMDKAGLKTSIVFLLAIFGAPIGGYITDRIRKRFLNARMTIPAVTSFLTALFLFIGFSFLEGRAQYLFLIFFGFTAPMFAAGGSAVTQDVVHPGLRAISYSLAQFFMMLLGYSLSPIFIGFISDRYDLLTAFKFLPLFALFGGAAFFVGSFFYVRDLHKVEKVRLEG